MSYEDIPGGCYTPDHWKIANGIDLQPENNSANSGNSQGRIKPYLTEESLDEYLISSGITVRLNVITHEVEYGGVGDSYNPESTRNDMPVILYDELKQRFRCDKQTLCDLLNLIAGRNRYNPVLELINMCEWDKVDYLGQLIEILGIREDDILSQTLLYKWSVQCYQLLHNQIGLNVSADGMLVLQGPQGCGKTSFVRQIGIRPDFVKLGQWIDPKDKDTMIFQQKFTFQGKKLLRKKSPAKVIPCSLSSRPDINNYQPKPAAPKRYQRILNRLARYSRRYSPSRPWSRARLAVMSAPLRRGASTTITPTLRPLMIRLRWGKCSAMCSVPGGYSERITPRAAMSS